METVTILSQFDDIDTAEACVRTIKGYIKGIQEIKIEANRNYGEYSDWNNLAVPQAYYASMSSGGAYSTTGIVGYVPGFTGIADLPDDANWEPYQKDACNLKIVTQKGTEKRIISFIINGKGRDIDVVTNY